MTQINPLSTLQNNTVEFIKGAIPILKACEAHQGRFTADALDQVRTVAPAIHVGLPAIRSPMAFGGGTVKCSVMTHLAIITKDTVLKATDTTSKRKLHKDEAMMAIIADLISVLPFAQLGKGVGSCEAIAADNITNSKISKDGVAIWGMHWTNTLTIVPPQEDGVTLSSLFYSWAPKIGADNVEDYKILGAMGAGS